MFPFYMVICYINQQAEVTVSSDVYQLIGSAINSNLSIFCYIISLTFMTHLYFLLIVIKKSMLVEQL